MKHPVPVFLFVVLAGILAIALAVLTVHIYGFTHVDAMAADSKPEGSLILRYVFLVLFPVIIGIFMGLAVKALVKREERKHKPAPEPPRKDQRILFRDLSQSVASIEASIQKLRFASELLKRQAGDLKELARQLREKPGIPVAKTEKPETRSITLENNVIRDIQVIQPADELIPQGLSPFPQSHRSSWFFPRR
jgi:hypothetical protein